jgi:hypothetical protein
MRHSSPDHGKTVCIHCCVLCMKCLQYREKGAEPYAKLGPANISPLNCTMGRAIAQAVSRCLPTSAAQVPAQIRSCGICGGQSVTGAGLLRLIRFPLPILIPPTVLHSSSLIRGWYNRTISGRRTKWTQSHPIPRK